MFTRKILVADEDNDTRVILRAVLERHQYVVVEANTADDAFATAQETSFDLVILNYPMKGLSGESLVHRLRAATSTQHVPILNVTSRVVPQFLLEAAQEGVDRSVAKPVDVESIVHVVSELTLRQ